jgi:uncharacterized caspase-like protein
LVNGLRDFAARAEAADWAVVYYAGHGMEVGGINYLIPTDTKIAVDRDIGFEAVPLEQVLNAAERAKKLRLVVLDACRDNPFANQMKRTLTVASRSVSRGLAAVEPEAGTLVVYAARDGEIALDGDGINSPFASAFVKNLPTPGLRSPQAIRFRSRRRHRGDRSQAKAFQLRLDLRKAGLLFRGWQITSAKRNASIHLLRQMMSLVNLREKKEIVPCASALRLRAVARQMLSEPDGAPLGLADQFEEPHLRSISGNLRRSSPSCSIRSKA